MRRRNHLRPDTFPFLAVLLCTMGSLILVLMILDRRARLAARDRVEEAWAKAQKEEAEQAEQAARIRRQHEEHQRARLEKHRLQVNRLTTQETELRAEYERVRSRLEATLRSLHEGEQEEAGLMQRGSLTAKQLEQARQELAGRKEQFSRVERRSAKGRTERERLSADLVRLEENLTRLRQQRQREQRTWSVVPYVGRRGRNSRPFYAECTSGGLIFHPDRLTLNGSSAGVHPVIQEVKRRIDQRRKTNPAGDPSGQPYWLLLVRPDGIVHYYVALAALKALDIEYGYEFVDADWILDFPDPETAPKAPEQTAELPRPRPPDSPGESSSPGLYSSRPRGSDTLSPEGDRNKAPGESASPGTGSPVRSGPPLNASAPSQRATGDTGSPFPPAASSELSPSSGEPLSRAGTSGIRAGVAPSGGFDQGAPPAPTALVGGSNPRPFGVGIERPSAPSAGNAGGGTSERLIPPPPTSSGGESDSSGSERLMPPSPFASRGSPESGGGQQGSAPEGQSEASTAIPTPPTPQGGERGTQREQAGDSASHSAGGGEPAGQPSRAMPTLVGGPSRPAGAGAGGGSIDPLAGPQTPDVEHSKRPRPPLRPAPRPGAGEWVIVIECDGQGVRVSPSRLTVPLADLARGRGGDVLLAQTILDMLERRRAAGRPQDSTFHPVIRFVVHREGLRAFHLAYPALVNVPVEKRTAIDGD